MEPGNLASKLRAKPATVRTLELYQEQVDLIPMMGVRPSISRHSTAHVTDACNTG